MNKNILRLPSNPIGPVKMVFLDLDGTTLNPSKELTPATLEALKLLKKHGIPFTFASARSSQMMALHCQKACISGPIIAMEGADLLIWDTGNSIRRFPIGKSEALDLIRHCHDSGFDYTIYTSQDAYFRQDTRRLPRFHHYNKLATQAGLLPVSCLFYEAYTPEYIASQGILKVLVNGADPQIKEAVQQYVDAHPALHAEGSEGGLISIVSSQASKAASIELLCHMLGIQLKDVCCFGDYYNDMEMLSRAGWSVAMGNAPEKVRNAAQFVTLPNSDDGVAYFIRHYICGE